MVSGGSEGPQAVDRGHAIRNDSRLWHYMHMHPVLRSGPSALPRMRSAFWDFNDFNHSDMDVAIVTPFVNIDSGEVSVLLSSSSCLHLVLNRIPGRIT
ncbi:hypothetical protein HYDPIDRAFT_119600 [Hydnomerulius pinastri MD-312]|uniref:Uncharacterized protein n=1 Tax=Hydnomerulius pinastri MD-312 TaxID=994086 RepID=A0A0C9UZA7_9AGAM|nr:hypothetical protein HYDPIDRAFT_119600 [Hydnomerulius pinastri MD-312]